MLCTPHSLIDSESVCSEAYPEECDVASLSSQDAALILDSSPSPTDPLGAVYMTSPPVSTLPSPSTSTSALSSSASRSALISPNEERLATLEPKHTLNNVQPNLYGNRKPIMAETDSHVDSSKADEPGKDLKLPGDSQTVTGSSGEGCTDAVSGGGIIASLTVASGDGCI